MYENIKPVIATEEKTQSNRNQQIYLQQRRIWEVLLCLFLMLIFLPICIIISVCILLIDGGPVLFRQKRIGKNGQPFIIWKFRTMKPDQIQTAYGQKDWTNGVPDQFVFKSSVQQGITQTGYYLRKYSLDELPQLMNVLRGEMSFIGPRPEIPAIAKWYNAHQKLRLNVKPGITGLAQINGRSNMNHGQKMYYDLQYIYHVGLLLDIKIVLLTVIKVFHSEGAY